ncbi:MAG: VOC family protein [Phycisphaerae bacterium]|nr:VOC family protein [Phycisphaerae bacterium]NUQ46835.1 VOC family protein [Phycisphaerae bacterium]
MAPTLLHAIDHVHLDVPPGILDRMRAFYADLLGLPLIDGHDAGVPTLCFGGTRASLRLVIRERPDIQPARRRLTLIVPSLGETTERLLERRVPHRAQLGLCYTDRRLYLRDPAGHLVELKQIWPF